MSDPNLPRPAGDLADDGVPATEEVRDEVLRTGDPGVPDMPMPDRPWGAEEWGTTDYEESAGEPLDVRLAREEPEGERGRSSDADRYDSLSPEEAAMSVREDDRGLGLNQDPTPGYLDEG